MLCGLPEGKMEMLSLPGPCGTNINPIQAVKWFESQLQDPLMFNGNFRIPKNGGTVPYKIIYGHIIRDEMHIDALPLYLPGRHWTGRGQESFCTHRPKTQHWMGFRMPMHWMTRAGFPATAATTSPTTFSVSWMLDMGQ